MRASGTTRAGAEALAGPPAVQAFGAAAEAFDRRFGAWASVAAQRRAVRRHLCAAFPAGAHVLELGGGTGEDAVHLAGLGYRVLLTDGAPSMVALAEAKVREAGLAASVRTEVAVLEALEGFAARRAREGAPRLDGAYSNFAALNCVADLRPVGRGLAALLEPGAPALLVVFGPFSPGEVLVQLLRGEPRAAFRRLRRGPSPARLGGTPFAVWYRSPAEVARAFAPWFRLVATRGVGVFVPPSAAEPWISGHPGLLDVLERLDRRVETLLARLGDHVLLHLERTAVPAPSAPPDPVGRRRLLAGFRGAYAEHRRREGRGGRGQAELLELPWVRGGPQAAQWAVRARTWTAFLSTVLEPCARTAHPRPLHVLDLGAGNAWLSRRVREAGHRATAVDVRVDDVDGLGAARILARRPEGAPPRVAGSFEELPLAAGVADLAVFNASLHYALDLEVALGEAVRTLRPGGRIVVLDSPFYPSAAEGDRMVAEKRREAAQRFGDLAGELMAPPFVEYLTRERLARASASLGLAWRRHRVLYPLGYELRFPAARLRGRRRPSRFDLWEAVRP